jgi:tripartite-type tricarboxylate transporter receptor subunit TctC
MIAGSTPASVASAVLLMLANITAQAQVPSVEPANAHKSTASAWPARPIRLVMPFPPGGATDANARVLAKEMESFLGQPVVVDNRGGANGIIGSDIVAKAAPDGYTMMHISVAFAINPSTYKKLPFDPIRDFTPITNPIVGNGALLVVHPSLPARSVTELIAVAKKQQLVFSSPGIGNVLHLINEAFNVRAGIRMLHVPYKGSGPALVAVLGGEAQVNVVPPLTATTHVRAERLRALGYSGIKRIETMPELPTIAEAGLPGFHIDTGWHGWFAPAKTPERIVNLIYGAIHKSVQTAKMREVFKAAGYEPVADPPAVFQKNVAIDIKRWGELVRLAKIDPE